MDKNKHNKARSEFLGMPFITARHRLVKNLMFNMAQKLNMTKCHKCGKEIEKVSDLTIEHKEHWMNVSPDLFWDLENVAFSHQSCNSSGRRNPNMSR